MKVRMLVIGFVTMACMFALNGVRSEAGGKKKKKDQPQLPDLMNPGPEHKLLRKTGKWTYVGKAWFEPGKPPVEMKGSTSCKMIMGGRYLQENVKGNLLGMPFQGMGVTAYDRVQKKWINTWVDNFGTGFMISEGNYDAAKKTWSYLGDAFDAATGKKIRHKMVIQRTGPESEKMEMYMVMGDQTMKIMELQYTRVGGKKKPKDG